MKVFCESCGGYSKEWKEHLKESDKLSAIGDAKYIYMAAQDDPDGIFCHHCGKINDFADDCGWWYFGYPDSIFAAGCQACWDGHIGRNHVAHYGQGDR